jgi:hypothetical protein
VSIVSVTRAGRRAAAALQTDACSITRPSTADPTFDATTGVSSPAAATDVYSGACRLRAPVLAEVAATAGEHQWTTQDAVLSLPIAAALPQELDPSDVLLPGDDLLIPDDVGAGGVQVGDRVVITASALDPDSVGQSFTVMAVLRGSQITARRLIVRQETS